MCPLGIGETGGSLIITVFWVTPKPFPAPHACPTGDIGAHSTAQNITVLVHYESQLKNLSRRRKCSGEGRSSKSRSSGNGVKCEKSADCVRRRRRSTVIRAGRSAGRPEARPPSDGEAHEACGGGRAGADGILGKNKDAPWQRHVHSAAGGRQAAPAGSAVERAPGYCEIT